LSEQIVLRSILGIIIFMSYTLPTLPYPANALEPSIDEKTMGIHHDKHHATYVTNLNNALKDYPELLGKPIDELIAQLDRVPDAIRTAVRNNGGGHSNHSFYWILMTPGGAKNPVGKLADELVKAFGSIEQFQLKFEAAGLARFGSGWVWLVKNKQGALEIISTPNQDSPIMEGLTPILGNDVWEHAYYLNYQNRRADYLKAWWNLVNWDIAESKM
jgi:Fe-Mn family superoxide dismutase